MFNKLFATFDTLIFLDLETTGLNPKSDQIIEFGALRLSTINGKVSVDYENNILIGLSRDKQISPFIINLTGITNELLEKKGVKQELAVSYIKGLLNVDRPLIVAYNAQFDLSFIYYFLNGFGMSDVLRKSRFLDAMTVYKDRRSYPHKLENAIEAFGLFVPNAHRALDDARATLALVNAMEKELDDLDRYINVFGFNPKYGITGQRISSVRYVPQSYFSSKKAYE